MKVTLIGKSKKVHEGVSKSKNIPYTYCDVVLTYEAGFVDGLMASSFRIFSPDSKWLESLEIGNEYEAVFDMHRNLTNLL